MARYIDAEKIEPHKQIESFGNGKYEYVRVAYMDDIDIIPTADVRENVRGEWIHKYTHESLYDRTGIWCSNCGKDALQDSEGYYIEDCETDFCPHCGADMRGNR